MQSEIISIETDKDIWIYSNGSDRLRQARMLGYECENKYLKERIKAEYPGFKINTYSQAEKIDFPAQHAIDQSLKWDNAYVAKQYLDGEVIAVDNYLAKYQILKKVRQPLYVIIKDPDTWNFYLPIVIGGLCGGLIGWYIL